MYNAGKWGALSLEWRNGQAYPRVPQDETMCWPMIYIKQGSNQMQWQEQ